MNKSLFNISKEAIELASLLEEGEYTPEIEQALAINQNELQEKAINYGYVVRSLESDVTTIDEEIKRLRSLKEAKTNAIDRMKSSVLNAMQIYGLKKIESPTLNVSIRESESVHVHSLDQLSYKFKSFKTTVSADKVKIKKAIKEGENIEGAVIVTNCNLQIK
jgi:alanine dehydrogenase